MAHKYNARPTTFGGYRFDSLAEADHYKKLLAAQQNGKIADLRVHPRFVLQEAFRDNAGKKERAIIYEADFSYREIDTGRVIVSDVKGVQTPVFKLKAKMFKRLYPHLELRIV